MTSDARQHSSRSPTPPCASGCGGAVRTRRRQRSRVRVLHAASQVAGWSGTANLSGPAGVARGAAGVAGAADDDEAECTPSPAQPPPVRTRAPKGGYRPRQLFSNEQPVVLRADALEQLTAVQRIQVAWRGLAARRLLRRARAASTRISACWRGYNTFHFFDCLGGSARHRPDLGMSDSIIDGRVAEYYGGAVLLYGGVLDLLLRWRASLIIGRACGASCWGGRGGAPRASTSPRSTARSGRENATTTWSTLRLASQPRGAASLRVVFCDALAQRRRVSAPAGGETRGASCWRSSTARTTRTSSCSSVAALRTSSRCLAGGRCSTLEHVVVVVELVESLLQQLPESRSVIHCAQIRHIYRSLRRAPERHAQRRGRTRCRGARPLPPASQQRRLPD